MDQPPAATSPITPELVAQERAAVRAALQDSIIIRLVDDLATARAQLIAANVETSQLRVRLAALEESAPVAPPPVAD